MGNNACCTKTKPSNVDDEIKEDAQNLKRKGK